MVRLFGEEEIRAAEEINRRVSREAARPVPICTHINFEKYIMDAYVREVDNKTRIIPHACKHFKNHLISRASDIQCPECLYCFECKEIVCEMICLKKHFTETGHAVFIYFKGGKKLYCAKCPKYHSMPSIIQSYPDVKAWIREIDINFGDATNEYIRQTLAANPPVDKNRILTPNELPKHVLEYFTRLSIADIDTEEAKIARELAQTHFDNLQPIGIVNVNKSCHTSCLIQVLMHLSKMNYELFRFSQPMNIVDSNGYQYKIKLPSDSLLVNLGVLMNSYMDLSEKKRSSSDENPVNELVKPDALIESLYKKSRGDLRLNEEQDFSEVFLFLFKTIEGEYNSFIRKLIYDTHVSKIDKRYYLPEELQEKHKLNLKLSSWYQYETVEERTCGTCSKVCRNNAAEPGTMVFVFQIGMSIETAIMSTLKENSVLVSCPICKKELSSEKKLNFRILPQFLFVQLVAGYNEECEDMKKICIENINLTDVEGKVVKYKLTMVICFVAGEVPHYFCYKFVGKKRVCLLNDGEIKNNLSYKGNKANIIKFGSIYIFEKDE